MEMIGKLPRLAFTDFNLQYRADFLIQTADFKVHVGFDTEWNVDIQQRGPTNTAISGKTAIITIAQDTVINILQVSRFVQSGKLPRLLERFLSLPNVYKIGRAVKADLQRLTREVNAVQPFAGGIELVNMAHEWGLVPNKKVSLAELCARILHFRLDKDPAIRTSTTWEDNTLPELHIQYAALDAWVSWKIYQVLLKIPVPGKLQTDAESGTAIALWTEDHLQIAAYGQLADRSLKTAGGTHRTKPTQTIITVTKVLVPAALFSQHHKSSLASFGTPPFTIVCLWRHLQLQDPNPVPEPQQPEDVHLQVMDDNAVVEYRSLEGLYDNAPAFYNERSDVDAANDIINENADINIPPDLSLYAKDSDIADQINSFFNPVQLHVDSNRIYSRVLKDVFHLMYMVTRLLSTKHGLYHSFSILLRNILLVPDQYDRENIERYATKHGQ